MPSPVDQLAFAVWLGAIAERVKRGAPPFELGDDAGIAADQRRFGYSARASPDLQFRTQACPPALVQVFETIAERARLQSWEEHLWSVLLDGPAAPPDSVLKDLIGRDLLVTHIGHLPLADPLLWQLSDRVQESRLSLALRRYLNPEYSADDFEEVLHAFKDDDWMLRQLADHPVEDTEKAVRAARYVRRHPMRAEILTNANPEFARLVDKALGAA